MGVTNFEWGLKLQNEADKCWFYALSFSICLSLYRLLQLFFARPNSSATATYASKGAEAEQSKERTKPTPVESSILVVLLTQLTIDCCDLTIPGFSTGWIPIQLVFVGAAQFTSSALAILHIWRRVQGAA
jgi:peroxin-11B